MKYKFAGVLAAAMLMTCCVAVAGCDKDTEKGVRINETFYNPIRIDSMLGDPYMYRHTDGYYYYMHSQGTGVTLTRSKWMTQMVSTAETSKRIFSQSDIGVTEVWAPEIWFIDGHWYCYFAATKGTTENERHANRRIYVMKSETDDAFGKWEGAKLLKLPSDSLENSRTKGGSWAIDATLMTYNGKHYLIWSGWPTAKTSGFDFEQRIYLTKLKDGDPTEAESLEPSARIQVSLPKYKEWESTGSWMNEGPAVAYNKEGRPFLFYSTSSSMSDFYCIAYCTLQGNTPEEWEANITNPEMDADGSSEGWHKEETPFFESDVAWNELIAPGHNSFVKSPDGTEDWICYHVAKYSGAGWDRVTRLQRLLWDENGFPKMDTVPHFSEALPLPSGEKVDRVLYEAENASLTAGAEVLNASDQHEDGSKLDFASGGKAVRLAGSGDSVTFSFTVPENGEYILSVRYANTSVSSEAISVNINGDDYSFYAPRTGSDSCYMMTSAYTEFFVKKGFRNTVVVKADPSCLIDCIIVDYLDR